MTTELRTAPRTAPRTALRVEVITIGDELLLGFTVDTNAAHLARELAAIGVEIVRRSTVGDTADAIAAAVGEALDRTGAVITTGGLGPTSDDLTKPSIAALFGRAMRLDEAILAELVERWARRGLPGPLPSPNRQQAMIPDGARILVNRHGSAPGIWLEDGRHRWVAMLPGVPREMRGMLGDELLPLLRARYEGSAAASGVVRSRTVRTTGIAESMLAERLGDLAGGMEGMPLAYLPGLDGVDLRLTARGMPADRADELLAAGEAALRDRIGAQYVYGVGEQDLAAIVLDLCRARGLRIAVAESCTGGLLGGRLTAIPGSSDVFWGGVIAYDNSVKTGVLGVDAGVLERAGAVSNEVADQMAAGVRARLGAEIGVAITGIAGPGGGTPEKPVGTVSIGWSGAVDRPSLQTRLFGDRDEVRHRATQAALNGLRLGLTD
jgi:nicotinamide-nucleotide amidase